MEEYTVALTPQAEQQLRAIVHHIAHELLEPETADALLTALEQAMASLRLLPQRAPLVEEEPWHSQNIRKLLCRNFLIYFWPDPDSHRVQVLAVTDENNDTIQQELVNVLALGEPAAKALIPKPNLSPAVKPTTAVTKTTTKAVTKTDSRKKK